jgi:hypothetical protein
MQKSHKDPFVETKVTEVRLEMISGCTTGTCPAVYVSTEHAGVLVQGRLLSAEETRALGIELADGESVVEVPGGVLIPAGMELAVREWKGREAPVSQLPPAA